MHKLNRFTRHTNGFICGFIFSHNWCKYQTSAICSIANDTNDIVAHIAVYRNYSFVVIFYFYAFRLENFDYTSSYRDDTCKLLNIESMRRTENRNTRVCIEFLYSICTLFILKLMKFGEIECK